MRSCRRSASAAAISVIPRHITSTGIRSRHLLAFVGSWRKNVPKRYESDAEVLTPSFHPQNGFSIEDSTIDGRTSAIAAFGFSFRKLRIIDSARLFVNVYVLGQPSSFARRLPASIISWRSQRTRFFRI